MASFVKSILSDAVDGELKSINIYMGRPHMAPFARMWNTDIVTDRAMNGDSIRPFEEISKL